MTVVEMEQVRVCQGCGVELPDCHGNRRWCSDRCRKRQYAGRCVDCGGLTNGSNGRERAAVRCGACRDARQHRERRWTREAVIRELQEWALDLGRTPLSSDALRAGARVATSVVQREFGSWNEGLRAAGLSVNEVHLKREELAAMCHEVRGRYEAGESSIALAAAYERNQVTIRRWILLAGGRMRSLSEAQRLAWA